MRVAVAGNGTMGRALLEGALESGHDVVGLLRDGRRTTAALQRVAPYLEAATGPNSSPEAFALRHRIPIRFIGQEPLADSGWLREQRVELLVVGDFGLILREGIRTAPTIGAINSHWSLLPRHRGPIPATAALLAGDEETGLTFHVLTKKIDGGDVLWQGRLALTPKDTAATIYRRSAVLAHANIGAVLDGIAKDGLKGTPQDPEQVTYRKRLKSDEVRIDWRRPAVEIDRMVRAVVSPLPWFSWKDRFVRVAHTRVEACEKAAPGTILATKPRVTVATGEGALVVEVGYATTGVPWIWPAPWMRVEVGERVG